MGITAIDTVQAIPRSHVLLICFSRFHPCNFFWFSVSWVTMALQKIEVTKFYMIIVWFLAYARTYSFAESSTCLMVYKEGGAPAVFQSPKCPLWKLSDYTFQSPSASHCQIAMHQGRRKYQEDRTLCALDVRIPFPGTPYLPCPIVNIHSDL